MFSCALPGFPCRREHDQRGAQTPSMTNRPSVHGDVCVEGVKHKRGTKCSHETAGGGKRRLPNDVTRFDCSLCYFATFVYHSRHGDERLENLVPARTNTHCEHVHGAKKRRHPWTPKVLALQRNCVAMPSGRMWHGDLEMRPKARIRPWAQWLKLKKIRRGTRASPNRSHA